MGSAQGTACTEARLKWMTSGKSMRKSDFGGVDA